MSYDMQPLVMAAKTADAYSADCFGPVDWVKATKMLYDMGFDDKYVEAILRSKFTRSAREAFNERSTFLAALYEKVITSRREGTLDSRIF